MLYLWIKYIDWICLHADRSNTKISCYTTCSTTLDLLLVGFRISLPSATELSGASGACKWKQATQLRRPVWRSTVCQIPIHAKGCLHLMENQDVPFFMPECACAVCKNRTHKVYMIVFTQCNIKDYCYIGISWMPWENPSIHVLSSLGSWVTWSIYMLTLGDSRGTLWIGQPPIGGKRHRACSRHWQWRKHSGTILQY